MMNFKISNFFLLLFFLIPNALISQDCEYETNTYAQDCEYGMSFQIVNFESNPDDIYNSVSWSIEGGDPIVNNGYLNHSFEGPGLYVVTATIIWGECEGTILTYQAEIEECACPTGVLVTGGDDSWGQCSSFGFNVQIYQDDGGWYVFDFGDGTIQNSAGPYRTHSYAEEGEYTVVVTYDSPYCEFWSETIVVNVEFCEGICNWNNEQTYILLDHLGDCEYQFNYDENYPPTWIVNGENYGTSHNVVGPLINGENEICVNVDPQLGCPLGEEFCFPVMASCEGECALVIDNNVDVNEDCLQSGFVSILGVEDGAEYWFTLNGEYVESTFGTYTYEFSEPGEYEICVNADGPNCPEVLTECFSVIVEDCGNDCELTVIYEEIECNLFVFSAQDAPVETPIQWYVNGEFVESTDGSFDTILEDGIQTVCAAYETEECPLGAEACVDLEVNCGNDCEVEIYVEAQFDCNTYLFIADGAPNGVNYDWFVDDVYIETTQDLFDFDFEEGVHIVCVGYETPDCPNGAFDCYTVEIDCDQDDCGLNIEFEPVGSCGEYIIYGFGAPEDAYTTWTIGGEVVAEGVQEFEFQFTENGTYTVCGEYGSQLCEQMGYFGCVDFTVDCFDDECQLEIFYEEVECNQFVFVTEGAEDGTFIQWFIDGEFVESTDGLFDASFEDGVHTVCAAYETDACPIGAEDCTEIVVNCGDECVAYIGAEQIDCNSYFFYGNGAPEGTNYDWFVNDVYIETSEGVFDFLFEEGVHVVCVGYETGDCPNGAFDCFTVEIECESGCPTEEDFYAEGDNCEWIFEIGSFAEGEEVIWNFGDGTTETGGHYIEHQYEEDGVYQVCVGYWSDACPDGLDLCIEIVVMGCNSECTIDLNYEALDECGSFYVWAYDVPSDIEIAWSVDGEYLFSSGSGIDLMFDEAGTYEICGQYETPDCPWGPYACFELEFEGCDDCESGYGFTVESDITEGGPEEVFYWITNQEGINVANGYANFDQEVMSVDICLELEPGCYQMNMEWAGDSDNVSSYAFGPDGQLPYTAGPETGNGTLTYQFGIESDCENENECWLEIQAVNIGGNTWEFSGFPSNEDGGIIWYFEDGTTLPGDVVEMTYFVEGEYEVCAEYLSGSCPDGVEVCTTIVVGAPDCTTVQIGMLGGFEEGDDIPMILEIVGQDYYFVYETSFENGNLDSFINLCLPDGCYAFNVICETDIVFDLEVSVYLGNEDLLIAEVEDYSGFTTIEFGMNTDCDTSIENLEADLFSVYPNPANNGFWLDMNDNINGQIIIYDAVGKELVNKNNIQGKQFFETSDWAQGIYYVRYMNENVIRSKPLIIQH